MNQKKRYVTVIFDVKHLLSNLNNIFKSAINFADLIFRIYFNNVQYTILNMWGIFTKLIWNMVTLDINLDIRSTITNNINAAIRFII